MTVQGTLTEGEGLSIDCRANNSAGNTDRRGWLSTIDLHIKVACLAKKGK